MSTHFAPICERYFRYHTYEGKKRKLPAFKPHQDEKLPTSSDKLLFLLTYLKGNHLQEFHGAVYDLSQAKVSRLVKLLQVLLDETLHKMGLTPARDSEGLSRQLKNHPDTTFNHDATERPIERKTDYEAQKEDYSAGPPVRQKQRPYRTGGPGAKMRLSVMMLVRCFI